MKLENLFDWFFDVEIFYGLGSTVYLYLYLTLLNYVFLGLRLELIKGYFEIIIIFAVLLFYVERADIRLSSSQGYFLIINISIFLLWLIGLTTKSYDLYLFPLRYLGFLIGIHIFLIIINKLMEKYDVRRI